MKTKAAKLALLLTLAAFVVQGCASVPAPPGCDGYSKRPINGRNVADAAGKVGNLDEGCRAS